MISARTNKINWDQALAKIKNYDCHHTFEYHQLSAIKNEIPLLLVFEKGEKIIALPLIKRKIENSEFYDFTSAYGYVGPISSENINQNDIIKFQKALKEYFLNENIVSVFSRLNPFIKNQSELISNLGTILKLSKIVYLDLNSSLHVQRANYSKITKRYINKANKFCSIKTSSSIEDILIFKDLYFENMKRVKAKPFYYFSDEYFKSIIATTDFETEVLYAILNETGEIISGAIMMKKNKIINYHLSGTLTKYMYLNPLRLIIDEARIQGSKEGFEFLNMGGGLGSREDSLFKYKLTFSKKLKDFKVWRYIVNEEVYDSLCKTQNENRETDFFPLYRNP